MHGVASFHSSPTTPRLINKVMADYLALEQARIYRRLFVTRFSLLACALAIAGWGLHWLSPFASWSSVALCAIAPSWAWIAELRCDQRLARRLQKLSPRPFGGDTASGVRKS